MDILAMFMSGVFEFIKAVGILGIGIGITGAGLGILWIAICSTSDDMENYNSHAPRFSSVHVYSISDDRDLEEDEEE